MALAIACPLLPLGNLDSLHSSRSYIDVTLQIPLAVCKRSLPQKLMHFASYNKHNVKNSAHAQREDTRHLNVGGGKTAIQRIAEKLRSLGYVDEVKEEQPKLGSGSAGEIFLPHPKNLLKYRIGHTLDTSWSTPEHPIPEPGQGTARPPVRRNKQEGNPEEGKTKRELAPTLAELTIPEQELKRLRTVGIRLEKKLKIGKAGISEGIVDSIHERWRNSEVVKIKCDDFFRTNMKRTHDILERKTGGLVIWRAGSVILLYRGIDYVPPYVKAAKSLGVVLEPAGSMPSADDTGFISKAVGEVDGIQAVDASDRDQQVADTVDGHKVAGSSVDPDIVVHKTECVDASDRDQQVADTVDGHKVAGSSVDPDIVVHKTDCVQPPVETEYEREINSILDGLGPRFSDWWGYDPLPVDADLLPEVVPGYKKPFRLLPYGMKPKLTDMEMTSLRRLARPLPPHFALGINEKLQGLAAAMVKLWEKSEIAKIAVKRGVQNTNSEKMAEELKRLTGGSLLSRDREFIVFYRGKDFIPPAVATVLAERKAMVRSLQNEQEKAQLEVSSANQAEGEVGPRVPPTEAQSLQAKDQWEKWVHSEEQRKVKEESSRARRAEAARRLDTKLGVALEKKIKVEKELDEVEKVLKPAEPPIDRETITEEERFMLRKLGLRMSAFLLLGIRGVFDGVIENMHLHWKYRELVKIISKEKSIAQVHDTARMLEYESGGILVAVERVNKGHAIIMYRGKNYRRPTMLRPKGLLTKKAALKRSIEIQRRESLNLHILRLERNIERLKDHISKVEDDKEEITDQSIDDLDSAYPFEDEEESTLQLMKGLDSAYPSEDLESGDEEMHFEPRKGKIENKDKIHKFQSLKNTTEIVKDKKGPEECHNEKNKMPYPVFRAEPLSNKERLVLRKQALKFKRPAQFHVGKSNVVSGLAKSIRSYFQRHALVKVGVKGRARGTSIAEIVFQLEEATGAVLVSQEPSKVILYRGWPEGQEKPSYDKKREELKNISPKLMEAIRKECGLKVEEQNENIQLDVDKNDHADKFCLVEKSGEEHSDMMNCEDDLMQNNEIDKKDTVQTDVLMMDFHGNSSENSQMGKRMAHSTSFSIDFQDNSMENNEMDGRDTA